MIERRLSGRYELLERLGEGGVAVVYRALDTVLDRIVAIKVLRQQLTADPLFLDRFRREAQAAARLNHPGIIGIYDVAQDEDWHYIVMEYVDGQDLKAFMAGRGAVPPALALTIAEKVCAALEHAHLQGFVHRDIKPQNILLARSSGDPWPAQAPPVKVADFGLVRSLSGVTASDGGVILGTVHYISPEQASGEPATPASDLYAVGVVLYEMLTGRLPFDSESPVGLALKHIQEQPARPSAVNPRLSPALDAMVLRALAKDPGQRFASAQDMAQALATYRNLASQATGRVPAAPGPARPPQARAVPARPVAPPMQRPAAKKAGFDWLLLALFIITFIVLAGLAPLAISVRDAILPPTPTPAPQVRVPNIVGAEQAVAHAQLQALGLNMTVQDGRFDDSVPAQRVIAQLVPPGTLLSAGHTVEVIVSRGREKVKTPPLVGLPLSDAQLKLGDAGLRLEKSEERSTQAAAGIVLGQDPAPDTDLERGAAVRLIVSVGDRILVPELFGRAEADAQRIIREAGLSTTFSNAQGPADVPEQSRWVFAVVPVGSVISQQPPAGAWVERGTVISVAVRKN